jgi:hypothetical protein
VLWDRKDIERLELGLYVVRNRDLPLYLIGLCRNGKELCVRELREGDRVEREKAHLLPALY